MTIGGCDLVVSTNDPRSLIDEILNFLFWENPIFEDDGENGFFVYPDLEAKERWDRGDAKDVRNSPMIYFICGEDYLLITSDELFIKKIRKWKIR